MNQQHWGNDRGGYGRGGESSERYEGQREGFGPGSRDYGSYDNDRRQNYGGDGRRGGSWDRGERGYRGASEYGPQTSQRNNEFDDLPTYNDFPAGRPYEGPQYGDGRRDAGRRSQYSSPSDSRSWDRESSYGWQGRGGDGYRGGDAWSGTQAQGGSTHAFGSNTYGSSMGSYGGANSGRASSSSIDRMWQGSAPSMGNHVGKGPKNYRRSDERLKEEISEQLKQHGDVDASDIEIEVSEGVVTLKGEVSDRNEKRCAEDCAANVSGVEDVTNQLRVRSSSSRENTDDSSSDASRGTVPYNTRNSGSSSNSSSSANKSKTTGSHSSGVHAK